MKSAVFFDRDGVLNEEVGYLHEIEKFKWIAGAGDAIKLCNEKNLLVIVVTNQSGIARGIYTEDDTKKLHHIDAFYYCPHHPNGTVDAYRKICDCRKPEPGLILRACKDFDINVTTSILIGDGDRDIEAGRRAGIRKLIRFEGGNLFDVLKDYL